MYKTFASFVLFQLIVFSHARQCDHDLCEPNGQCVSSNNGSYSCKCKQGYRGQHCEVEECLWGQHCKMTVDYCSAYPKVNCQNEGKCVNVFQGFRCLCPSTFEGKFCERQKEPHLLDGEIVVIMSGDREKIIENLDQILAKMDRSSNFTVQMKIDQITKEPMIFELENSISDETLKHGRSKRSVKSNKVALVLNVDKSKCVNFQKLGSTVECPKLIESVASQLESQIQQLNQIFEPFGIQIISIVAQNYEAQMKVEIKQQLIIVFVLLFVILCMTTLIACLLVRKHGHLKKNIMAFGQRDELEVVDKGRLNYSSNVNVYSISTSRTTMESIDEPDSNSVTNNHLFTENQLCGSLV